MDFKRMPSDYPQTALTSHGRGAFKYEVSTVQGSER